MKKWYFLFVITLFLAIPCAARVIIVDASGTGDYPTIQAAINAANTGDTVELQPGTYTGDGNRNISFLGKAITLQSIDPNDPCVVDATVIDCNNRSRGVHFYSGEGPNSILSGLTITNGSVTSYGAGIVCYKSGPRILNCTIRNSAYCGIYVYHGEHVEISNCKILNNSSKNIYPTLFGAGICCRYSKVTNISYCLISGNTGDNGAGIGLGDWSFCEISNCTITSNYARGYGGGVYVGRDGSCNINHCTIVANYGYEGGGLYLDGSSSKTKIKHCIFWNNRVRENIYNQIYGSPHLTYCDVQRGWPGIGNIDADPLFADPELGDYHLLSPSPCIDAGDPNFVPRFRETDMDGEPRVMGAGVDMGADEFTQAPAPFLGVSEKRFVFDKEIGGFNPDTQNLSLYNIAYGSLNWEITSDCNWLSVYPYEGSINTEIDDVNVIIDMTGLSLGSYHGQLIITSDEALNSPQTIDVNLIIHKPVITLSTNEMVFLADDSAPEPNDQILIISSSDGGTLNWSINNDCNWLYVYPNAGSCAEEANYITVSVIHQKCRTDIIIVKLRYQIRIRITALRLLV